MHKRVIDNIPFCADDSKAQESLQMVNLYLRNVSIPMAAATLWLSGFEAYKAAIKAITNGLAGKTELIDWDVIKNGLKFIEIMGKELDDETLQTKSQEAQKMIETIEKAKDYKEKLQGLKEKLDEINEHAKDKKIGITIPPENHYDVRSMGSYWLQEKYGQPPVFADVPGTGGKNDADTIPCKELEESLKQKEEELEKLKEELASIDGQIAQAKKDLQDCNNALQQAKGNAKKAGEEFNKQANRKHNFDKNKASTPEVDQDYNDAKKAKEAADANQAAHKKKCNALKQKIAQLENRKSIFPELIKALEDEIGKLKEELEKCKQKEAEKKQKEEEEEKRKEEEARAATTAAQQQDKARAESAKTQRYLLQNIYDLGLVRSKEFWEMEASDKTEKMCELIKKLQEIAAGAAKNKK